MYYSFVRLLNCCLFSLGDQLSVRSCVQPGPRFALLTGADGLLRGEAGLRVLRGDALDGRQGDVGVRARQPRRLRLLGPALQVARLQGVGPAPPAAHGLWGASSLPPPTSLLDSSLQSGGSKPDTEFQFDHKELYSSADPVFPDT